jgi:hypothetical protein
MTLRSHESCIAFNNQWTVSLAQGYVLRATSKATSKAVVARDGAAHLSDIGVASSGAKGCTLHTLFPLSSSPDCLALMVSFAKRR